MFRFKNNEITLVADVKWSVDLESFEDEYIKLSKPYGQVYVSDGKVYRTFTTKLTSSEVVKLLEKRLYKCKATIGGGNLIFVNFNF